MDNRRTSLIFGMGCLLLALIVIVPLALGAALLRSGNLFPGVAQGPQAQPANPQSPLQAQPNPQQLPETGGSNLPLQAPDNLPELYQQVNPGVVSIGVSVSQGGQQDFGEGSGFVYDQNGYIVTNNHVVNGATSVVVSFYNGTEAQARVVGADPNGDLAIIQVDGLPEGVHPLPIGDSDQVLVGEEVVAIGNPFSLGSSMTAGIVSAVGRTIPSGFTEFSIPKAIQTDAAINPGNSGGPLVNMAGEVIGVNAQIQTTQGANGNIGIGFAIPSNLLKLVAPALIERGSYQWPWVGVSGIQASAEIAEANGAGGVRGAYIDEVVPGSPAERAGLQGSSGETQIDGIIVPSGGDIVTAIDGQPIDDFDDLLSVVAFRQPGDQITLTVLRSGEEMQVQVTLEPRP
ncbi:MAG: PDZ domain-containing protein [Chloroflexota bacterium]|nr:MAG: PDZ domain-containing protein [Chloroflexota bacterium]